MSKENREMSEKSLEDKYREWVDSKWETWKNQNDASEDSFKEGYELAQKEMQEKLDAAIEVIIFYSNLEEYEDTHEQLDWNLVNNPSAMQDKGKRARDFLKARGE